MKRWVLFSASVAVVGLLALGCAHGRMGMRHGDMAMHHGEMCCAQASAGCSQACMGMGQQAGSPLADAAMRAQGINPKAVSARTPAPMAGGCASMMAAGCGSAKSAGRGSAMAAGCGSAQSAGRGSAMAAGCASMMTAKQGAMAADCCPEGMPADHGKMERTRRVPDPAGWGWIERPVRGPRHDRFGFRMLRGGGHGDCGCPCCPGGMKMAPGSRAPMMQRFHRQPMPHRGTTMPKMAPVPPPAPTPPPPPPAPQHH